MAYVDLHAVIAAFDSLRRSSLWLLLARDSRQDSQINQGPVQQLC